MQAFPKWCYLLLTSLLPFLSFEAFGAPFEGRIVGLDCAKHGYLCPLHKFEQHISQETEFVLLSPVDDIYRLSGISRDTLVRHANKKVIINGTIDTDSHSIKVQQLQVQLGNGLGRYESVWQAP